MRIKLKYIKIIENFCALIAVMLFFTVDWRLGLALFFYEANVAFMILRKTDWRGKL